jgi:hypothetical protein
MTREEVQGSIDKEFARAREAHAAGNDGKARVCARRAAGLAISFWLERHREKGWGLDNMNQLQAAAQEAGIPDAVRGAAVRLTTKITEKLTAPFSADPVADGGILVDHFLED